VSGYTFRFDRTPGYSPPTPEEEHVLTRDSYGFAAVAISCVTGRIFLNDADLAVGMQEAVLPDVVRNVLASCLDKDAKARPPLASLLKQRLEQACAADRKRSEPIVELFLQLNQRTRISLGRRFDTDDERMIERFVEEELGEVCGLTPRTPVAGEPDTVELIGGAWRFEAVITGRDCELLYLTQASEIGAGLASDLRDSALVAAGAGALRPSDGPQAYRTATCPFCDGS
jgi:hypothetical protein